MDFQTNIVLKGCTVTTLADILPEHPPMRMLIVGKAPSLVSVEKGHYFQGPQGRLFWGRLEEAGILQRENGLFHDELLVGQGFGVTDIAKLPLPFGQEPTPDEYREGWRRVEAVVARLHPQILTFVYKGALDAVLRNSFGWKHTAHYGFNEDLLRTFGRRVFAFPLPGTPCTRGVAVKAMAALKTELASI